MMMQCGASIGLPIPGDNKWITKWHHTTLEPGYLPPPIETGRGVDCAVRYSPQEKKFTSGGRIR
jgi:hypothetical protein